MCEFTFHFVAFQHRHVFHMIDVCSKGTCWLNSVPTVLIVTSTLWREKQITLVHSVISSVPSCSFVC